MPDRSPRFLKTGNRDALIQRELLISSSHCSTILAWCCTSFVNWRHPEWRDHRLQSGRAIHTGFPLCAGMTIEEGAGVPQSTREGVFNPFPMFLPARRRPSTASGAPFSIDLFPAPFFLRHARVRRASRMEGPPAPERAGMTGEEGAGVPQPLPLPCGGRMGWGVEEKNVRAQQARAFSFYPPPWPSSFLFYPPP